MFASFLANFSFLFSSFIHLTFFLKKMKIDEAVAFDPISQKDAAEPYKPEIEEHIENNDQDALMRVS